MNTDVMKLFKDMSIWEMSMDENYCTIWWYRGFQLILREEIWYIPGRAYFSVELKYKGEKVELPEDKIDEIVEKVKEMRTAYKRAENEKITQQMEKDINSLDKKDSLWNKFLNFLFNPLY